MPKIISLAKDETTLNLTEFIQILDSSVFNFETEKDLIILAGHLKRLNNNKDFLFEFLTQNTRDDFQKGNVHNPNVFNIHSNEHYLFRAVIWNPLTPSEKSNPNFKYDVFHDHNFDLLTIGYFGAGYYTQAYTYDSEKVVGFLGETVTMEDQGIFNLSEGEIFFYKAKKDIHNQIPPDELSISLNIIPKSNIAARPQYEFDEIDGKICRYIQVSGNELMIRLSGLLKNEADVASLFKILKTHTNPHNKAYSALAITQIEESSSYELDDCISKSSDLVFDLLQREKKNYGSCI